MKHVKKKIVILGAGFGGLRTALVLGKGLKRLGLERSYEVLLVDRNSYHTYTPLLYEVATTSKETADLSLLKEVAAYDIGKILKGLPITFLKTEATGLDLVEGEIALGSETFRPDYLVLALGSETNFFGIPGLKERAFTLKTFVDAIKIRDAIWNLALTENKNVNIVIGGAGPTGVELAGELKAWCGELEQDFKKCNLDVTIIEAGPTILPGFDTRLVRAVGARLGRLGIHSITGDALVEVKSRRAILASGREVPYDVLVWTGGIKAPAVLAKLPTKNEAHGKAVAHGTMECLPETPDLKFRPRVYGLGDSICFYDPVTQKPVPAVARAAIVEGNVVGANILEDVKRENGLLGEPHYRTYVPRAYPYVAPVGGKYAVAKIGPVILIGFLGWVFKGLIELTYLCSIMPLRRALPIWLKGLTIFIQNDRLG